MLEVRRVLCLLVEWLDGRLPTFDDDTDRHVRRERIMECTKLCFSFASCLILVALPLWNTLSLTSGFFRVSHFFKRNVFKNHSRLHSWRIWHNTSLQQLLFWSVFVGVCTFVGAGRDLIQITKRMGRLSVALMPPLLFLTLRPSPLPETLYLSLIPIHRWLSRVVVVESLLHTILYVWFMHLRGSLVRVFKPANFAGVIAMVIFGLIGVTSVSNMRRWNFQVFYYIHYLGTWMTVGLLHYHARPSIPFYTSLNVAILSWQIIYRVSHTKITTITTVPISPSLTLVEFPRNDLSSAPILPSGHVRLSQQHANWLKWLFHQLLPLQHPYTIASLPTDDVVKLIVRNSSFPFTTNTRYRVTGAFEPKLNFMSKVKPGQLLRSTSSSGNLNSASLLQSPLTYFLHARRALICVGGSAISFALPLLRILNFNGVTVKLIWASKDYRDLKVLNHFKHNFEGMEIYVSGATGSEQDIQIDYIDTCSDSDDVSTVSSLDENDHGYNERTPLTGGTSAYSTLDTNGHLSSGQGTSRTKNYDSIINTDGGNSNGKRAATGAVDPNDEIDFTEIFSLGNSKSTQNLKPNSQIPKPIWADELFRKPSLIQAPTGLESNEIDEESRLVPDSDKVLRIPSGIKVFFGRPSLGEKDYLWCTERECAYDERVDDGCEIYNGGNTHTHDLSDVVVIAAGPVGLVEGTRRFATDHGLNFHAECFTV